MPRTSRRTTDCLGALAELEREALLDPRGEIRGDVEGLVDRVLDTLTAPADVDVLDPVALRAFVRRNPLLANLAAATPLGTTDEAVGRLLAANPADPRLLVLISPRNRLDPATLERTIRRLAQSFPDLVASWASRTFALYSSAMPDDGAARHLKDLLSWRWLRFGDWTSLHAPYLGASYVDPEAEPRVRRAIHRDLGLRLALLRRRLRNRPNPRRVALISANWVEGHVVHRTMAPLVRGLIERASVTLFHLGNPSRHLDREGFESIHRVTASEDGLELGPLTDNDFGLVFHADVGIHPASILLASLRLAPVQAHGAGHPVSAPGSELDVFVSGDATETESAQRFYAERLDLLPGRGADHRLEPRPRRARAPKSLRFVVNCSWSSPKVTVPMLEALAELDRRTTRRLLFRFFSCGFSQVNGGAVAFRQAVERALPPGTTQVVPFLEHADYLDLLADGEIALDSHPFGGSNTVVDSLSVGVPIVSWEGERWPSRIGAALLRAGRLPELIVHSRTEWLTEATRLIEDDAYRRDLRERVLSLSPRSLEQPDLPRLFAEHLLGLAARAHGAGTGPR